MATEQTTRPIERDYLRAFADRITLDEWGAVVTAALERAKAGDSQAREWITRIVLTREPMQLKALARRELTGVTSADELQAGIEIDHDLDPMQISLEYGGSVTALEYAERKRRPRKGKPLANQRA